MCGVVGWVDFHRDLRKEHITIEAMTRSLESRGPDGAGTWTSPYAALGHRRLAVIDLDGGQQPMVAETGSRGENLVLVYNGEIYNYRELRQALARRGHVFASASDTEVVLRAYQEWGAQCVEHLNGMFAFAVWDAVREELFLARDRMGIKPLYYAEHEGGLLFASEPKGIFAHPTFEAQVDEDKLPILLNPRLAVPGETPLHGVREVKPAHVVRMDRRGIHEYPYWRLVSREHTDSLDVTVKTVRELLEDIVARQTVADVPVSSMLSGGLDSTAVSALAARALARRSDAPLQTFCVGYETDEEHFRPTALRPEADTPYARIAAEFMGSRHRDVILPTDRMAETLPIVRRARDLPSLGQFDTSIYLLFKEVRKHATVALTAEAADEVFGGYPWFHDEKTVWQDTFPWMGDAPRLADCLAPDVQRRVRPLEAERDRYHTLRAQVPRLPGETGLNARMREVLHFSLAGPLQSLLDKNDRMSMAVGLETRVPFCDHRLIEYVWNVPWTMKTADGREKSLLRMAAGDVVPPQTLQRKKSGYPGTHDPAYEAAVHSEVDRILGDHSSPLHGLLDRGRVDALRSGGQQTMTLLNSAHLLLPLIEIDAWMRDYRIGIR
ncbi:asparagine synthase (glutamine-hydrolyzing) [Streptomyces sp. NPDC006134]|uniref:asparagine synthase (glutamine-hydrolyzing) n=1 Tax=Streptomyces sp. NPDC006134 TaxID=3154467 RepID=UPI00340E1176